MTLTSSALPELVTIRIDRQGRSFGGVTFTAEVERALRAGAVCAIGVSGGKDSCALAFATNEALDAMGHTGPRVLIHSDLGRVEWSDSLPTCERLAARLGLELIVVRRKAGDMMDRWLVRWKNNLARYADLSCVKLILPWSTPAMRFCTSELKTAVICRELIRRFPGYHIVSAAGIRREESPKRKLAPVAKEQKKLRSKRHRTDGVDWNPIIDWTKKDVFAFLESRGFSLHEAYTTFGMSRVSCRFCIMQNEADQRAAAAAPESAPLYREMVELETVSTFAFQGEHWLGDVAPQLLTDAQSTRFAGVKLRAARRELAESRIPAHLLYTEGWPTVMPTRDEAELIAEVRRDVAAAVGIEIRFTSAAAVLERYAELMAAKSEREADA